MMALEFQESGDFANISIAPLKATALVICLSLESINLKGNWLSVFVFIDCFRP